MQDIRYEYDNMTVMITEKDEGKLKELKTQAKDKIEKARDDVSAARQVGKLHFMDLPHERKALQCVQTFRQEQSWVKNFVVLGIGGSALGAIAVNHTFNTLSREGNNTNFYCFDNVDPEQLAAFFQTIDLRKTLFDVVSKSGSTLETAAGFLYARQELKKQLGEDYKKHLVFTTSETVGLLRDVAAAEGIEMFVHPDDVGGRFTVLSIVGLLPAVFCGVDGQTLLEGAARMDELCNGKLETDPAMQFALQQYWSYEIEGQNVVTMMPYSYRLKKWPEWFKQLWAESLGKKDDRQGHEIRVGQTPTQALGTTDQHSQIQLFNFGPRDRNIVFLEIEKFDEDITIEHVPNAVSSLDYLQGKSFQQIMQAELAGTKYALRENMIPSCSIVFPEINEFTVGQFIYLMEYATALSGELYDINAFDQPGVELGKQIAFGLLGRKGYEEWREKVR